MVKKILVVDDESMFLQVITECLELGGYESCTASGGEEGLRQLYEQRPDLVITDMRMPGMDGYEFARRVRQTCDVPIIMLTGAGLTLKDMPKGLFQGFIAKPVQMLHLLTQVEMVLACGSNGNLAAVTT